MNQSVKFKKTVFLKGNDVPFQEVEIGEIIAIGGRKFFKHWEGGMLGACIITEPITGFSLGSSFNEEFLLNEVLKRINNGQLDEKIREVSLKYNIKSPLNDL